MAFSTFPDLLAELRRLLGLGVGDLAIGAARTTFGRTS
jgi:hypothetical protein